MDQILDLMALPLRELAIMMAATLAQGETILTNVAKEPEIIDLADMLNSVNLILRELEQIRSRLKVSELSGTTLQIPADRIEAGTYLVAKQ